MSPQLPPKPDPIAAQRWQHWPRTTSPWLHEEVARRMQERLNWIKLQPGSWVHWQALSGGLQAHALLLQRYRKARCTVFEYTGQQAQQAAGLLQPSRWHQSSWMTAKTRFVTQIEQPVQMLWANMALHMSPEPQALIGQWHQALQTDGFLMFSTFGPDTLQELRDLYQRLGWEPPVQEFTDMHHWGDMLLAAGFAQPVLDVERMTLTFASPQRLLQELRELGRNLHPARFAALRGRNWQQKLLSALAQQPLQLTFEIIYGHAFKSAQSLPVGTQSHIKLEDMRRALAQHKT